MLMEALRYVNSQKRMLIKRLQSMSNSKTGMLTGGVGVQVQERQKAVGKHGAQKTKEALAH